MKIFPWKFSKNPTRETEIDACERIQSFSPRNWKQKLKKNWIMPVKQIFLPVKKNEKSAREKKVGVKNVTFW